MTVTLKEAKYDPKEAKVAIDRILRAVIRPRYSHYIGVLERHKSGAIHYHFVVHVGRNIRRRFSWRAMRRQEWFKLPKAIRDEWAYLRGCQDTCPDFGWFRLEPIKKGAPEMARYLTKYLVKGYANRDERDKGTRLYRASNQVRAATTRFMWVNDKTTAFRWKVGAILKQMGKEYDDLPSLFGSRWAMGVCAVVGEAPIEDLFDGQWLVPDYVASCLNTTNLLQGRYDKRIGYLDPIWQPKEWPGMTVPPGDDKAIEEFRATLVPGQDYWPEGYTFVERGEVKTESVHDWLKKPYIFPVKDLWRQELLDRQRKSGKFDTDGDAKC